MTSSTKDYGCTHSFMFPRKLYLCKLNFLISCSRLVIKTISSTLIGLGNSSLRGTPIWISWRRCSSFPLGTKKRANFGHTWGKQGTKRIFLPMKVSLRAREDKLGFFLKKCLIYKKPNAVILSRSMVFLRGQLKLRAKATPILVSF